MGMEIGIHKNMGGGKEVRASLLGRIFQRLQNHHIPGDTSASGRKAWVFFCVAFTDEFCSGREG
jgi:hypothetical protein